MQTIRRIYESFNDLHFEVDLTDYGKDNTDVAEIIFSVKENETDADDAIFEKKETTGGISFTGTTVLDVLVTWLNNEYGNFTIGRKYKAGLFIQFTGDPNADENVDQIFELVIEQDFLRA